MEKKEYLCQAYFFEKEIRAKREQIESLESLLIYTSPKFGDIKIKGGEESKEDLLCKVTDLKDVLVKDICKMVYIKNQIICTINQIEDSLQRTILFEKYINFKTFEVIAEELNYSNRQIIRLHNKAQDTIDIEDIKLLKVNDDIESHPKYVI